ncbi:MAG TPA: sigma factor-like helix-turn-helix DNA-binding protein, partial [Solirubrobacteraceae bacterium]|nr:sigma factor-like helix-turn-helix DNA-binding protein [Solirubrobacteraceae bacterium]
AMPTRQAAVLWAREVEGLSYDEIGDRFGMTEPSVRSVLHRARRTLRREYAVRGGTLPGVGLVALAPWLESLRWAAKLRHVARRTSGAAALTATGLVIATVAPFGAHTARVHQSPPTKPALTVRAAESTPAHRTATVHHVATAAAHPAAAASSAAGHAAANSERLPHTPAICGARVAGEPVSAGCATHHKPTIYIKLPVPVAGNHEIGISNSSLICQGVPTTGISECDTSTSPSKGTTS